MLPKKGFTGVLEYLKIKLSQKVLFFASPTQNFNLNSRININFKREK